MALRARFYPAALQELQSSHAWYEERSPGAGGDFVDEVFRVIDRLIEWPSWARRVELPELAGLDFQICRAGTRRFEYGIVYHNDQVEGPGEPSTQLLSRTGKGLRPLVERTCYGEGRYEQGHNKPEGVEQAGGLC